MIFARYFEVDELEFEKSGFVSAVLLKFLFNIQVIARFIYLALVYVLSIFESLKSSTSAKETSPPFQSWA